MKGLLLNNIYFYRQSYSIGGPIFVAAAILYANLSEYTAIMLFWFTCSFMLNIGSMLQAERLTGWATYETILPVKKHNIILAKYSSYLFTLITRLVYTVPIIILLLLIERPFPLEYVQRGLFFGIALALFTGAFVYPLYLIQKENDSSSLLLNSIGCSIAIIVIIWALLRALNDTITLTALETAQTSLVVSVVAFFLSCFISVIYYGRGQR